MRDALALIAGIAAAVAVSVLLGWLLHNSAREMWSMAGGVSVTVFVVWFVMRGRARRDAERQ